MRGWYRWVVLAIALASTAIGIMTFAAAFPLLNLWVRDLGISHAEAGVLTGLWYFTGFAVALPVGWLADRVPLRRLLLGLWALNMAGTLLMATASGFLMLCAGRAIFSIGTTGHMVAAPKLVATWFHDRKEYGLVMGLYSMSMTVGVYASLFVLGRIGEQSGWRAAMLLVVALTACGFLMMLALPHQPISANVVDAGGFSPFRLGLAAWVLALAYGGYNVATEAYLTFSPDYLVRRGIGVAAASAIVGVYAWVALGLKPVLAFYLRRTNGAYYIMIASLAFIGSVMTLLTTAIPPTVSAALFGGSMALAMPAFYALPPLIYGSGRSGQVYGLCEMCYGLGAIVQPLIGWTIDRTGQFTAGYEVLCGLAGLSLLGGWWLAAQRAPAVAAIRAD